MAKISTLQFTRRAEAGAECPLMDPLAPEQPLLGADGVQANLILLGTDSAVAKRHQQARAALMQSRLYASAFSQKTDKTEVAPEVTAEDVAEQEAAELDLLVALTVGWRGFEDDEGAPVPCTSATVRALYEQCPPIRAQALTFVTDRARFFAASATPSAPSLPIASA
ncbi:MAG: hypothetical protein K2R93_12365 [Gemmatimonadaceae bacterium]|nr:hypothetical protein [Gemmatimonadaceae bacterium]